MRAYDVVYMDVDVVTIPHSWKGEERDMVMEVMRAKHGDRAGTLSLIEVYCRDCRAMPNGGPDYCRASGPDAEGETWECLRPLCEYHAAKGHCYDHPYNKKKGRPKPPLT